MAAPDKPILDQMVKFYADQQLAQIDATTKQEQVATAQADAEQAAKDLQAIKDQYQAELQGAGEDRRRGQGIRGVGEQERGNL